MLVNNNSNKFIYDFLYYINSLLESKIIRNNISKNRGINMIGSLIVAIIIFFLSIMAVIVKTEGLKLTLAGIFGIFGLTWGYLANTWSNFTVYIVTPAINTIFGTADLNFYNVSAIMVLVAWIFVLFISILNILLTYNKKSVKLFQNWTESETDNI